MGDNRANNNSGHQLDSTGRLLVLPRRIHNSNEAHKKIKTRMEKVLLIIYNYVCPIGYISTVLLNINNFKGVMLTFLAVIYALARIIFYVLKQDHERRMRNLDYKERKMNQTKKV